MKTQAQPSPACSLSDSEISCWAPKLGTRTSPREVGRTEKEHQLRCIVTRWFERARLLYQIHTRKPNWPNGPTRVDKALPEIAQRLGAARNELLALPGEVEAALRVRFGNYDCALTALAALSMMLTDIAQSWHKPHRGQPSLAIGGEVVGLLISGVEEFTCERFASPRSYKRADEREFIRLLMARLLPDLTDAQFKTALRHWDKQRRAKRM
jgi:hypothetical protein